MSDRAPASSKISSLILRADVRIPPPKGPARQQQCCIEGVNAIEKAKRAYGRALGELDRLFPGVIAQLPQTPPGVNKIPRGHGRSYGKQRVEQWFSWHYRLKAAGIRTKANASTWRQAEQNARESLKHAVAAYNWLDDLIFDIPPSSEILLDCDVKTHIFILDDAITEAHDLVHRTGELVGGIFGCRLKHDKGDWKSECQVSISHLRFGFSPGMLVRHLCNVCGIDPGDCDHEVGEEYMSTVNRFEGHCNVCSKAECSHIIGSAIRLVACEINTGIEIQEVSLVARPRDPLARVSSRGIDNEELIDFFGFLPDPAAHLLCHECMYPCAGFKYLPDHQELRKYF
ncbi:hypothetical protein [Actinomadura atramentaria]|uniref:hypothetical protein n=1 Tax=Actinomadura atramentaria TaxID=1990 RepID=UPI0012F8AE25|nr:hypothetical protein [Actinomadura atramentaria]